MSSLATERETPGEAAAERTESPTARGGLRDAALDGVRWFAVARLAAEALSIGAAIVLARLVSPAQFGMFATSIIVRELALMIANESVGAALVQRRQLDTVHLRAGMLIALLMGLLLTGATLVVTPLVVTPLFGSGTADLFRLFAPAFVIAGVMIVPYALLQRQLAFRQLAVIDVSAVLLTSSASIALALAGLGAKAYVIGTLAGMAFTALACLALARPPAPRWHAGAARELLHFGLPAAGAGLAGVAYRNADYLIVGARLGPQLVGFYYRAFTVGVEYEGKISGVVSRIAFPIYSRTTGLDHLRAVRSRIIGTNVAVVWPLTTMFVVLAPILVPWVFGARWAPAVLPAQILALAGMAQTVRSGTSPVLLAVGRPRALLLMTVLETVAYAAAVFLASSHGLTIVAIVVSAFQILALAFVYSFVLGPLVGVGLRSLFQDVGPALAGCAALAAAGFGLTGLLGGLPVVPHLALVCAGCTLVYSLTLRTLFRGAWDDVELLLRRVPGRGAAAPAGPLGPAVTPR